MKLRKFLLSLGFLLSLYGAYWVGVRTTTRPKGPCTLSDLRFTETMYYDLYQSATTPGLPLRSYHYDAYITITNARVNRMLTHSEPKFTWLLLDEGSNLEYELTSY